MFKDAEIFESFKEHTKNVQTYKDYDFSEGYDIVYRPFYKRVHKLDPPKKNYKQYHKKRTRLFMRLHRSFKEVYGMNIPYKIRKELIDYWRKEFKDV